MCSTENDSIFINITILMAGISTLLSLAVIMTHFIIPNLRKNRNIHYPMHIISSVFIYNLFSAIYLKIWGLNVSCSAPMRIIASIAFFGLYSSIIWCVLFAWNIYQIIVKNIIDITKNECYHAVFTYGISLIVAVLYKILALYYGQCTPEFLPNDYEIVKIIFGFIPEVVMVMIAIVLYVKIIIGSKTTLGPINYGTFLKQIILYPIVVVILITCTLAQQINFDITGCLNMVFLGIGVLKPLICIMNAILYGYNSTVREEIKCYCQNHRKPLLIQEISLNESSRL